MMIKKKFSFMIVFILFLGSAAAKQPVRIFGKSTKAKFALIKLFKVFDGGPLEIGTSATDAEGYFGFMFYPEYEGLYLIGTGNVASPQDNYKFWFKPGDQLAIAISDTGYTLSGSANSKENLVLTDWYKLAHPVEWKSVYFMKNRSTYVDFFPELQKLLDASEPWLKNQHTGNKVFDQKLPKMVRFDMAFFANTLLTTPRSAHPDKEELPPYYATLSVAKLFPNSTDVYFYPWGKRAFSAQVMRDQMNTGVKLKSGLEGVYDALTYIPNDTLKGDYVLQYASRLKDYTTYQDLKAAYGKYIITPVQQKADFDILTLLATFKPGDPGYKFSYPDPAGKAVSLADLKGKVVLIDVWATWCGPCKAEIPHLQKLEEEMKGTDVAFVSLSVDEEKDKEKWKKMIVDDKLGGIQLFASGWSDFAKYYKINAIPRFLVFDRQGKIVSVDSPRPSNPELKTLLEKTLAAQ